MAKGNLSFVKNEKEHREMYRSSFRNIDTDLGFYNYSDKGELLGLYEYNPDTKKVSMTQNVVTLSQIL